MSKGRPLSQMLRNDEDDSSQRPITVKLVSCQTEKMSIEHTRNEEKPVKYGLLATIAEPILAFGLAQFAFTPKSELARNFDGLFSIGVIVVPKLLHHLLTVGI